MNKWVAALSVNMFAMGHAATTTQPTTQSNFAPMAYFEQSCARCHGDYGANYGDQFGKRLTDAQLAKAVDDMCSGPGNAPLTGEDLQREIAFHRALVDGKPFVCVTGNDGKQLSGEMTEGASVSINGHAAKVDGTTWISDAPASQSLTIMVKLGDRQTTLILPASYSHAQPSTAPSGK